MPKGARTMVFRSKVPVLLAQLEIANNRRLGISELVKGTGLESRTLRKWLRGETMRSLDPDVVHALIQFLNCKIDDLIAIEQGTQDGNRQSK